MSRNGRKSRGKQERVEALECRLEELKLNVDERSGRVIQEARDFVETLENVKLTFLLGIPERIRKMTMEEFAATVPTPARAQEPPQTAKKMRPGEGIIPSAATPIARRAREGEWVLSENGSPLGRIGDGIDPRRISHAAAPPSTPSKGGDVSEFLAVLDSWKMKASRQSTADVASAPTDDLADKIEKLKSDLLSLTSVIGTAEV